MTQERADPGRRMAGVLVVVVNYRTAELVCDCVGSLAGEAAALPGMRLVVVDNDSQDGSVERIRGFIEQRGWTAWARVMTLGHNGGYGAGNNAAIKAALEGEGAPEYFFLLNPDTVVCAGAVRELVEFMEAHPRAGIAGSKSEHSDGRPQVCAFRFPSVLGELETSVSLGVLSSVLQRWQVRLPPAAESREVDWVSGAALMVRRGVLGQIGLMDERFFMYFEEVDFCRRAKRAEFEVWHVPASRIVHLMGAASGVSREDARPGRRPAYWFRAQRLYWLKNHGPAVTAAAEAVRIVGTVLRRCHTWVRGRVASVPEQYVLDLCRHSVFVKGFRT